VAKFDQLCLASVWKGVSSKAIGQEYASLFQSYVSLLLNALERHYFSAPVLSLDDLWVKFITLPLGEFFHDPTIPYQPKDFSEQFYRLFARLGEYPQVVEFIFSWSREQILTEFQSASKPVDSLDRIFYFVQGLFPHGSETDPTQVEDSKFTQEKLALARQLFSLTLENFQDKFNLQFLANLTEKLSFTQLVADLNVEQFFSQVLVQQMATTILFDKSNAFDQASKELYFVLLKNFLSQLPQDNFQLSAWNQILQLILQADDLPLLHTFLKLSVESPTGISKRAELDQYILARVSTSVLDLPKYSLVFYYEFLSFILAGPEKSAGSFLDIIFHDALIFNFY
jgi:hypothetical protein